MDNSNQKQMFDLIKSISGQANILTVPRLYITLMEGNIEAAIFLRNRGLYLGRELMTYLERAHLIGIETERLKMIALESRNWTEWRSNMEEEIGQVNRS